ncbi:hypothetical protein Bpfe_008456 [Biomphalaria pfeifferi]|uniref:Uncharacterized protein n=1 Tax=Biomphalaria pfeifferi TaxID=112525 RepID=A0AAD8BWI3_BIOPF|nr:hypothetical protein Bpfe_008451 [Biomphalaria pfeifferi]KAK0061959.1 hypothetical protein Bpfe_008452 [Biomphalaria pfeifferi]KAK0061962.1 hypothetical protein Bpfe_008455 [Biomphalaria pfeifferi]KAK0061963.1 hypothetical protein Bpfe_008456 [Biomphalaria pfeifferi]
MASQNSPVRCASERWSRLIIGAWFRFHPPSYPRPPGRGLKKSELAAFQAEVSGPVCTYNGSKLIAWHPHIHPFICLPIRKAPTTGCQHNGASTHTTSKENLEYR